jgi:hypothetical protein
MNVFTQSRMQKIKDFIEKRGDQCKNSELKEGVDAVIGVLEEKPNLIMDIITGDEYIDGNFYLHDLAVKMKQVNQLEKLGLLFDHCLDRIIQTCVCNMHDLERCREAMPSYIDKVMDAIVANEGYMQRILHCQKRPEEILQKIATNFPKYHDAFLTYYNRSVARPGL